MLKEIIFVIKFIVLAIGIGSVFMSGGVFDLANVSFYVLIALILVDVFETRTFSLYSVWILGFVYMILSEMLTRRFLPDYVPSARFLLGANYLVLLAYQLTPARRFRTSFGLGESKTYNPTRFLWLLLFFYVFYLYNSQGIFTRSLYGGRQLGDSTTGNTTLTSALVNALSTILPSLWAYYIIEIKKKKIWWAFLVSLPVFIILFVLSTRFKFLFSVLPLFMLTGILPITITNYRKTFITYGIIGVLMIMMSAFIKENRNTSLLEMEDTTEVIVKQNDFTIGVPFSRKVGREMSAEGVLEMTYEAQEYFKDHPHTYGLMSGFFLYFWIPRGVWPSKPTMLDSWLPRYFNPNLAGAYSSASGFTGEPRSDFGIVGALFVMLIVGFLLKRGNTMLFEIHAQEKTSLIKVFGYALYPFVFFAVRSPITSTTTLIWEVIVLNIMHRWSVKRSMQ